MSATTGGAFLLERNDGGVDFDVDWDEDDETLDPPIDSIEGCF
jgi:hypothetical protein